MRTRLSVVPTRIRSAFDALPMGRFGRSVSQLAGGAAVGQLVLVLCSPIVTRLYSPADMGIYSVYGASLSILATVVALRYEVAIPLEREFGTASNTLAAAFTVVVGVAAIVGAGTMIFGDDLVRMVGTPELARYLWILPLALVGTGAYHILNHWAIRDRSYGPIAATKVYKGVAQSGIQIGIGLFSAGPLGLILGQAAGQIAGVRQLGRLLHGRLSEIRAAVSLEGIGRALRAHWRFPVFSGTGALLNSAGLYLPAVLIAFFYGPEVAGWFAIGQRVLGLPVALVGQSVSQVYLGESASLLEKGPGELRRLFKRTAVRLGLVALGPALALVLFAPPLFSVVFGSSWNEAGVYVQLLVPMLLGRFVVTPLSHTLNILRKQSRQFVWNAFRLLLMVGLITAPALRGESARVAILGYSLAMLISYAALYVIMDISLRQSR